MCKDVHAFYSACGEIRVQPARVSSLFLTCGSQWWNSSCQAWWPLPLPTEPSRRSDGHISKEWASRCLGALCIVKLGMQLREARYRVELQHAQVFLDTEAFFPDCSWETVGVDFPAIISCLRGACTSFPKTSNFSICRSAFLFLRRKMYL